MPFQNTGTLLENIVVVEAARQLFAETTGSVTWASAFSMPPLTVWRRAERYLGEDSSFSIARLNQIAANAPEGDPGGYSKLLHRCLRYDRMQGPNAALLVGLLAQQHKRRLRAWVEDVPVPRSHYGPTQAPLEALGTYVSVIGKYAHTPFEALTVSSMPYPACIEELRDTLQFWRDARSLPASRLGYLDPNVYVTDARSGPQTSPADHRRWLNTLTYADPPWSVSVHFSSNRNSEALRAGLRAMSADAEACGYHVAMSYVHHNHSTTVVVRGPTEEAAAAYMQAVEAGTQNAWSSWMDSSPHEASMRALYRYQFAVSDEPIVIVEDPSDLL